MVRIRLRRVGSKNQPSYRIVAADKESPRDGRFLENLGHYNPRTEPATVEVDEARLFHWLRHGAQPSEAVHQILNPLGTWDRWERFKAGEELDILLEEAKESSFEVDPRTRRDDLAEKRPAKKAEKKAKAPVEKVQTTKAEPVVEEPSAEEKIEEESAPAEDAVEVSEPEAAVEVEETEAVVEAQEPEAAVEAEEPEAAVEVEETEAAVEVEETEAAVEVEETEEEPEEPGSEAKEEPSEEELQEPSTEVEEETSAEEDEEEDKE